MSLVSRFKSVCYEKITHDNCILLLAMISPLQLYKLKVCQVSNWFAPCYHHCPQMTILLPSFEGAPSLHTTFISIRSSLQYSSLKSESWFDPSSYFYLGQKGSRRDRSGCEGCSWGNKGCLWPFKSCHPSTTKNPYLRQTRYNQYKNQIMIEHTENTLGFWKNEIHIIPFVT